MSQQMKTSENKKIILNPIFTMMDGKDNSIEQQESMNIIYNYIKNDPEYLEFENTAKIAKIGDGKYQVTCDKGKLQMKTHAKDMKSINFLAFVLHYELCNYESLLLFEIDLKKYPIDDLRKNKTSEKYIDLTKKLEIGHLFWSHIKYLNILRNAISYAGYRTNNMYDFNCENKKYELKKTDIKMKYGTHGVFLESKTGNMYDVYGNQLNIDDDEYMMSTHTHIDGINNGCVFIMKTYEEYEIDQDKNNITKDIDVVDKMDKVDDNDNDDDDIEYDKIFEYNNF